MGLVVFWETFLETSGECAVLAWATFWTSDLAALGLRMHVEAVLGSIAHGWIELVLLPCWLFVTRLPRIWQTTLLMNLFPLLKRHSTQVLEETMVVPSTPLRVLSLVLVFNSVSWACPGLSHLRWFLLSVGQSYVCNG